MTVKNYISLKVQRHGGRLFGQVEELAQGQDMDNGRDSVGGTSNS